MKYKIKKENKITQKIQRAKKKTKNLVRRCRRAHTAATATENATLLPLLAQKSLQLQLLVLVLVQSKRLGTL